METSHLTRAFFGQNLIIISKNNFEHGHLLETIDLMIKTSNKCRVAFTNQKSTEFTVFLANILNLFWGSLHS